MKPKKANWRIRFALWLIGPLPLAIRDRDEELYQSIWPKHDDYAEKNRSIIRLALARTYFDGCRR